MVLAMRPRGGGLGLRINCLPSTVNWSNKKQTTRYVHGGSNRPSKGPAMDRLRDRSAPFELQRPPQSTACLWISWLWLPSKPMLYDDTNHYKQLIPIANFHNCLFGGLVVACCSDTRERGTPLP